jgi:hypothetical protein
VILPGPLDLHGHSEFNVFAAWEPPQLFANRYLWRGSPIYQALVRDTQDRLLDAGLADEELRYAEIRTCWSAGSPPSRAPAAQPQQRGGPGRKRRPAHLRPAPGPRDDRPALPSSRDAAKLREIVAEIGRSEVDAFYLHLAEGQADIQRSTNEFGRLVETTRGSLMPRC